TRPLRTVWTLLVTLTSVCLAQAQDSRPSAPLTRDLLASNGWDEEVRPASAPTDDAASLTARVEALERAMRGGATTSFVDQEKLPDGAAKAVEKECKPVDIITKPTFTPTGRLFFDAVNFDDDDDAKAFFNTDRDNEFGIRRVRLGGKGYIYENLYYAVEV